MSKWNFSLFFSYLFCFYSSLTKNESFSSFNYFFNFCIFFMYEKSAGEKFVNNKKEKSLNFESMIMSGGFRFLLFQNFAASLPQSWLKISFLLAAPKNFWEHLNWVVLWNGPLSQMKKKIQSPSRKFNMKPTRRYITLRSCRQKKFNSRHRLRNRKK